MNSAAVISLLNETVYVDENDDLINVRVERRFLRDKYNVMDIPENKYV